MRGRKPAPTALKKLNGVRKSRINAHEPQYTPESNGTPPAYLDKYAIEEWNRLYPELAKKGTLTVADRMTFVGYCEAYHDYRTAKDNLKKNKNRTFKTPNGHIQSLPFVKDKKDALDALRKFSIELGITPSSRSRIHGKGDDGGDEDQDFLFGKKGAKK